jgi:quercetin dioxygenase-like cupin family protein
MKIRTAWFVVPVVLFAIAIGTFASRLRAAGTPAPVSSAEIHDLMARNLLSAPGKEVRMLTVEYAPGGSSPPHRHNAEVFVYVLQGSLRMQLRGSPAVTLLPGATFYEAPDDVHEMSANASDTEPAKFLVFTVKDKSAAISSPAVQGPQS